MKIKYLKFNFQLHYLILLCLSYLSFNANVFANESSFQAFEQKIDNVLIAAAQAKHPLGNSNQVPYDLDTANAFLDHSGQYGVAFRRNFDRSPFTDAEIYNRLVHLVYRSRPGLKNPRFIFPESIFQSEEVSSLVQKYRRYNDWMTKNVDPLFSDVIDQMDNVEDQIRKLEENNEDEKFQLLENDLKMFKDNHYEKLRLHIWAMRLELQHSLNLAKQKLISEVIDIKSLNEERSSALGNH